jgi:hypothetical protein
MSPERPKPEKRPPAPALSPAEADFNRWMEHLDLEALDLERLKRQTKDLTDEPADDEA